MSTSQRPDKAEIDYATILQKIGEYKQTIDSVVESETKKTYPDDSLQSLRVAAYKELKSTIDIYFKSSKEKEAKKPDEIEFHNLYNFIKAFFSKDAHAFKQAELKEDKENATLIKDSKSFYQYIANEASCLPLSRDTKYSEADILSHIERQSKLLQHLETLNSHKENKYDIPERSKAFEALAEKLDDYLHPANVERSISKNVDTSTLLYIEAFLAEDKKRAISAKTKGQERAVSQEFYRQIPKDYYFSDGTSIMTRHLQDRTATEAVVKSHFQNIIKSIEKQATDYVKLESIATDAAAQANKFKESKESKTETIYSTIERAAEVAMKGPAETWSARLLNLNLDIIKEITKKKDMISRLIVFLKFSIFKITLIPKALEHLESLLESINKIPDDKDNPNHLSRLIAFDALLNTEGMKLISMIHNFIQKDFIPTLQSRPGSAIKCLQQKDPVNYKDSALGIDCYVALLLLLEDFRKTVEAEIKLESAEAKIGFDNKMDIFQAAFTRIISPDMPQDPWAELTNVEKELAAIDRRVILNSEMKRFDYADQIENSIPSDEKKDAKAKSKDEAKTESKDEAKDIYSALKKARNHAIEAYKERIQKLRDDTSKDAYGVLKACQEEKNKFERFINYAERLNEQVIVASRRAKTKNWKKEYEAKDYFKAFLGAVSAVYNDYRLNPATNIDPTYHAQKMLQLKQLDAIKKQGSTTGIVAKTLNKDTHFTQLIDDFDKMTDKEHPYLIWTPPKSEGLFNKNKQNKRLFEAYSLPAANLQRFRDMPKPKHGPAPEHKHTSRPSR